MAAAYVKKLAQEATWTEVVTGAGAKRAGALKRLAVDPEYVLKWVIGTVSLFEFCRHWLGFPARGLGWRWLGLCFLVVLGADYGLRIPGTAYALAIAWCLLVGLPSYALGRRQQALHSGRLSRARRWAQLFALLHPFDEARATSRWIRARSLAAEGRVSDAEQLLHALEKHPTLGELARLEGLLLTARWSALVERLEQPGAARERAEGGAARGLDHPGVAGIALQAYGETGKVQQMLASYRALEPDLVAPARAHLEVAAYLGSLAAFELAVEKLPAPAPEMTAYFRGVALQAAGERLQARTPLQAAEAHPAYQQRALARLRRPLEPISSLAAKLQGRAAAADQALRFSLAQLSLRPKRPWATWSLSALIIAMFLRSFPGGALDPQNLVDMGALLLPQDRAPGLWRIVTAGFLHAGVTHLALDLLLVLLFGSVLERLWGSVTLLSCFICANVGSYAIATWLFTATPDRPELLLGASAGAFGIVGALIAFDAVGWVFERSRLLLRRISMLTLLLLAQLVFDSFTPIVRSSLHVTGALLGALVAIPFAFKAWRRHAPSH